MEIEIVPLLQIQRELYRVPRGLERFRAYVQTLTGDGDDTVLPPLVAMNPLGKEHVALFLDKLLALDAEAIAAQAAQAAAARLPTHMALRLGLVATDDAHGGWTNRTFADMTSRFQSGRMLRQGWAMVSLWTADSWTATEIELATRTAVYRAAWVGAFGEPRTLGAMLRQEGFAALFADAACDTLDPEDLAYSHAVIAPHHETTAYPLIVACLYGDAVARSVGYPPLGLSANAGYAVALDMAHRAGIAPEAM